MALNGVIDKPGDVDQFVFKATKGQVFDIHCYARRIRSPLDSVMYLGKKGGGAMLGADDSSGPTATSASRRPKTAEYVIWLVDHLGKGGPDYVYRIEVTPVEPQLAMTTNAEQIPLGTGVMSVAVPKGNRQAILIYGNRADFGGDLNVGVERLAGRRERRGPDDRRQPGGRPGALLGQARCAAGRDPGAGHGQAGRCQAQRALASSSRCPCWSSGQNNVNVWSRTVDRLAVAVTEECPYTIEIVEPKVPLVRGGSMDLKVRANRKPGFKAAIAVYLPWNPPGVGSGGGIAIPEGQNEAVIPMNADGGAELRTWKIVVNGASGVASGPIMVSSQLANLTIAAAVRRPDVPGRQRRSRQGSRHGDQGRQGRRFPRRGAGHLIGLPNKVTTDVKKITKDTTDLVFHIKTDKVSPAGNHASLFCRVVITQNGEPIVHNIGTGTLRIDVPLPPKANAPAPAAGRRGSQARGRGRRQAADPAGKAPAGKQASQDRRQVSTTRWHGLRRPGEVSQKRTRSQ